MCVSYDVGAFFDVGVRSARTSLFSLSHTHTRVYLCSALLFFISTSLTHSLTQARNGTKMDVLYENETVLKTLRAVRKD